MLDDQDGVAGVDELLEHVHELANVLEVQARGGLVEDVEGLAGLLAVQLLGELDALGLAAGERGGGLAQVDVAQAHVVERLELVLDARDVGEEGQRLVDRHVQHVRDGLAVIEHLERLAVVALAVADLAGHVDVRQEVHLDLDLAVALAGLAAPSRHVEREAPGAVAARAALGQRREEGPQVVPEPDVGGRVGARGAPDRRLVDVDDLVDELHALELLVRPDRALGAVDGVGERGRERVRHERALARARDAGDHRERAELDLGGHVLQVVGAGAGDLDRALARVAAPLGQADLARSGEVGARDGFGAGRDLLGRAGGDHASAQLAGARTHVDHVVRGADGVLVVLDHNHRVAEVAQALERGNKTLVVALM